MNGASAPPRIARPFRGAYARPTLSEERQMAPKNRSRTPPARLVGRPVPRVQRTRVVSPLRRQLEESFPLLFFGVACLVMSAVAFSTDTHLGGTRYPLWVLFLALGSIAAAGGTASMLSEDDVEGFSIKDLEGTNFVAIPRTELEELRRAARPSSPRAQRSSRVPPSPPTGFLAEPPALTTATAGRQLAPRGTLGLEWDRPENWENPLPVHPDPLGLSPPIPDDTLRELDELAAELARPRSTVSAGVSRPTSPTNANLSSYNPETLAPSDDDFRRAGLLELGFPEEPPDLADSWLDPAELPPEFAQLLAEIYPPTRIGDPLLATSAPVSKSPTRSNRCPNCAGQVTGVVAQCADCHRSLCRRCGSLALLTSDKVVCDVCLPRRPKAKARSL